MLGTGLTLILWWAIDRARTGGWPFDASGAGVGRRGPGAPRTWL